MLAMVLLSHASDVMLSPTGDGVVEATLVVHDVDVESCW
jgi:hypothetical protein